MIDCGYCSHCIIEKTPALSSVSLSQKSQYEKKKPGLNIKNIIQAVKVYCYNVFLAPIDCVHVCNLFVQCSLCFINVSSATVIQSTKVKRSELNSLTSIQNFRSATLSTCLHTVQKLLVNTQDHAIQLTSMFWHDITASY